MSDTKAEGAVSNSAKAENQKDTNAEDNTKGRRSSSGKPKVSRIMKDVQEGEALLKQMGHKEEEANVGRRTTRSSARGSVGSLATPPPPAKRERRSGSTSTTPPNNAVAEKAVEKEKVEPKKKASPPAKKAKVVTPRRGGRGRGRPKKSTEVEDHNSEEEPEAEEKGNHVEESSEGDAKADVGNDTEKDEKMEVDEVEAKADDKTDSVEAKANDTGKVPESPKKAETDANPLDTSSKDKVDVRVDAVVEEKTEPKVEVPKKEASPVKESDLTPESSNKGDSAPEKLSALSSACEEKKTGDVLPGITTSPAKSAESTPDTKATLPDESAEKLSLENIKEPLETPAPAEPPATAATVPAEAESKAE